jgi:hypothetical protein
MFVVFRDAWIALEVEYQEFFAIQPEHPTMSTSKIRDRLRIPHRRLKDFLALRPRQARQLLIIGEVSGEEEMPLAWWAASGALSITKAVRGGGASFRAFGSWLLVPGARCQVPGARCMQEELELGRAKVERWTLRLWTVCQGWSGVEWSGVEWSGVVWYGR